MRLRRDIRCPEIAAAGVLQGLAEAVAFGQRAGLDMHAVFGAIGRARRNGAHLPLTALIDGYYAELQALSKGRLDTSSLVERLRWPARRGCSTGMLIRRETPECVSP